MDDRRPPYLLAGLASLLVLVGYVVSLAPTVTFWDAGEFIAAAKTLGIPHPPGTPLFVMIGHVWGTLIPFGEFAQRTNLLSATLSALGAGCFFLVIHEALSRFASDMEGAGQRLVAIGGSFATVVIAGFTFTSWQNSNETEVYAAATFTIAAMCWLCLRWRELRGTPRASHLLLLILYLAGVSIGNHLLALLAGPAVVAFLVHTIWSTPAADQDERRAEWAQAAVVAGTWALLIGSGLGSTTLVTLGGLCYVVAAGFAATTGSLPFALVALVISFIGVTSYLYLYIRSGLHPPINEAQPDNWTSLLAVIRREQYPVRTPLDDPTVLHGPDNPGRTLKIFGLQLVNYIQYFDWQWANGVTAAIGRFPLRTLATLLFTFLGLRGQLIQRRADRSSWWLLFMLWLVTGLGLVVYMNFKPGFSMAYDQYPDSGDHEVRDRDYFFVVSYTVWGLWAGMGLVGWIRAMLERLKASPALAAVPMALVAIMPFVGNFDAAGRRHGPDARLAADFAYDLLNSVPPYGILFTYGDNDTFPLWWAQEVQGIRQDVLVVCLALTETDWYKRQLRDFPIRKFDEAAAPGIWQGRNPVAPTWKAHSMSDQQIEAAAQPRLLPDDLTLQIGPLTHTLRKGTPIYSHDYAVIRMLQDNLGRRPIAWSLTTGGEFYGLNDYILQQGLVMGLQSAKVDTTGQAVDTHRILGVSMDVPATDRLVWETYRYAGLGRTSSSSLEPTARGVAGNLALPFAQLAYAYMARGDRETALKNLERASALSPNPALKQGLLNLLAQPGGDSAAPK
jgi:transmembrane protein TMEM260 (protein O-mannosyltransferase)